MATQLMGEATQQVWDDTLTRLLSLSSKTIKRNVELENRLTELEVELSVWKRAHSAAVETSERETTAHKVQLASLNHQISTMSVFTKEKQNPLILCVIDGDENLFNPSLLVQGQVGGRAAAQQLTKAIAEYLSNEEIHIFGRLSFWVSLYINKNDVLDLLLSHNICSREQFEGFMTGFSQTSPRFLTIDVGVARDGPEMKIKEYLQTYTPLHQTLRVFFSGRRDDSYAATLSSLDSDHLLGKLVALDGTDATEPPSHTLPIVRVEGLFMNQPLPRIPTKPSPLTVGPPSGSVTTNGGLISPQSPPRNRGRLVDPSLPLHKQSPPPCNEHYLMTCSKGPSMCKYSHDYVLTPEQLASLASNAKKAPCNWLKNGMQCPYGEQCCWGHVCPNGPKCFHLSKGKCWFKGDAMHPPISTPSTPSNQMC